MRERAAGDTEATMSGTSGHNTVKIAFITFRSSILIFGLSTSVMHALYFELQPHTLLFGGPGCLQ